MRKKLTRLSDRLETLKTKRVMTDHMVQIEDRRMRLDRLRDELTAAQTDNLSHHHRRYIALASSLDAMSPLRVLSRGYSIASGSGGTVVKSVTELSEGEKIRLRLSDGSASCVVDKIL